MGNGVAVSGPQDRGDVPQRGILESILGPQRIETGAAAAVPKFETRNIKRNGTGLGCDPPDLCGWNEEELGIAIDESPDQPWARKAIVFQMLPGNPLHVALLQQAARSHRQDRWPFGMDGVTIERRGSLLRIGEGALQHLVGDLVSDGLPCFDVEAIMDTGPDARLARLCGERQKSFPVARE